MNEIIQTLSLDTIGLAIDANKIAHGSFLSTYPHGVFHEDPGISWFETGIPIDPFNGVVQTRLELQDLPAAIERVNMHFQQRALPFYWTVGPSSHPTDSRSILEAYGLVYDEDEPGMAVDLHTLNTSLPQASELTILPVTNNELLWQWTRVWGTGYEEVARQCFTLYSELDLGPESPFRLYLAFQNGEPVATAALFLAAGVAAIERVVTVSHARRQGIGAALVLKVAQEALRQGYRIGVLTASPMGINIYRRFGVRECCIFHYYLSKGARD